MDLIVRKVVPNSLNAMLGLTKDWMHDLAPDGVCVKCGVRLHRDMKKFCPAAGRRNNK